jgi:hypothetical protein
VTWRPRSRRRPCRPGRAQFPLDLEAEEEVERRPDGRHRCQLPELGEAGRDGGAQDVGRELELQAEHEEAPEVEPEPGERVHALPAEGDEHEPRERDHRADEDDRRPGRLDQLHQDVDHVLEVVLAEAVGQGHHCAVPGPGLAWPNQDTVGSR